MQMNVCRRMRRYGCMEMNAQRGECGDECTKMSTGQ